MAISYSMQFGVLAGAALIAVAGCSDREGQAAQWQEYTYNGKRLWRLRPNQTETI